MMLAMVPEDFPDGAEPSGEVQLAPDGLRFAIQGMELRLTLPGMGN